MESGVLGGRARSVTLEGGLLDLAPMAGAFHLPEPEFGSIAQALRLVLGRLAFVPGVGHQFRADPEPAAEETLAPEGGTGTGEDLTILPRRGSGTLAFQRGDELVD